MFTIQLSTINKLGDKDLTYGQAYWGKAADDLTPIKFNSMNDNITAGSTITAEEKVMKMSSKGIKYWQLKKVKVAEIMEIPEFGEQPATGPQNTPRPLQPTGVTNEELMDQIMELHDKLDRLGEPRHEGF